MADTQEHGRRSDVFANLIEHVGQVVEDVRKMVEERGAPEKVGKREHSVRGALSKVSEAVKKRAGREKAEGEKPEAGEGEKPEQEGGAEAPAGRAGEALRSTVERTAGAARDELKEILQALAGVVDELRSVIETLSKGLEQAEPGKEGGGVRAGIERAREFLHGRRAAPEEPTEEAGQPGQEEERREERPQEQERQAQERQAQEPREGQQPGAEEGKRPEQPQAPSAQAQEAPREGAPREPAAQPSEGAQPKALPLFDGSEKSAEQWTLVGSGSLRFEKGELRLDAGPDRGLAYFKDRRFDDFKLRLQFKLDSASAQVMAAVRFLDPEQPVPDREDPKVSYPYDNPAYVAAHTGFEILMGGKRPASEPGVIEGVLMGGAPGTQRHAERADVKTDDWNDLEIEVRGNRYSARLNGRGTSEFENGDSYRGKPAGALPSAGYLGFEIRSGRLMLRRVEAELAVPAQQERAGAGEEAGKAESQGQGQGEAKPPQA